MFVLHIDLKVKPGLQKALEQTYVEIFRPAISGQEGFSAVNLLRSNEQGGDYRLSLAFESQVSQKKWVATDAHQDVWPQIEKQCAEYSVRSYNSV